VYLKLSALAALATAAALTLPAAASAAGCPRSTDVGDFASERTLKSMNKRQADFGARPTGSDAQAGFVEWIEDELDEIPGLSTKSEPIRLTRWDAKSATLTVSGAPLEIAAPVPYSKATGTSGVTAPLTRLEADAPITRENASGKIVVLDRPNGTPLNQPEDIRAASDAGAVAVLFAIDLPKEQIKNIYRPYEGVSWRIPAAYIGADESQAIQNSLAGIVPAQATFTLTATTRPATTRQLTARLRGGSAKRPRLIVQSHTDGVNALWDNGPLVILAMARHFADLPAKCRPRTIDFVFTTAHLYQSKSSADRLARQLDDEYDDGKIAAVVSVEHFGARRYNVVPRPNGAPGRSLVRTSDLEVLFVPVSQSPALKAAAERRLMSRRVQEPLVSAGLDQPVAGRAPANCNFGGEGNPYHRALLPTIGAISGSQVLFTPGIGIETIDFDQMRRESLAFTDVVMDLGRLSDKSIAGDIPKLRRERASGAPGCEEKSFNPREAARATPSSGFFCTLTSHRQ
jgi:hypothetical protein